jgi:hypothetical protein
MSSMQLPPYCLYVSRAGIKKTYGNRKKSVLAEMQPIIRCCCSYVRAICLIRGVGGLVQPLQAGDEFFGERFAGLGPEQAA